MPSDKDIVVEARDFAFSVNDDAPIGLRGKGLLRALADEVEALRRGEFICKRCHHRKDSQFEAGEF